MGAHQLTAYADKIPVPAIKADQMRQVDDRLMGELGYSLLQIMENAGTALAQLIAERLGRRVSRKAVLVFSGHGHNGGGGLVAARRLAGWGADVRVVMPNGPSKTTTETQKRLAQAIGVKVGNWTKWQASDWDRAPADIVVDALVGYGLQNHLAGAQAEMVGVINGMRRPIVSLDIPSGLSADGGGWQAGWPIVKAAATLTLALPKVGLVEPLAERFTGDLYLADIGVPSSLYAQLGWQVPDVFGGQAFVRLSRTPGSQPPPAAP